MRVRCGVVVLVGLAAAAGVTPTAASRTDGPTAAGVDQRVAPARPGAGGPDTCVHIRRSRHPADPPGGPRNGCGESLPRRCTLLAGPARPYPGPYRDGCGEILPPSCTLLGVRVAGPRDPRCGTVPRLVPLEPRAPRPRPAQPSPPIVGGSPRVDASR